MFPRLPRTVPVPIQVECYAGHKADETPRRFLLERVLVEFEEVVDMAPYDPEWPKVFHREKVTELAKSYYRGT